VVSFAIHATTVDWVGPKNGVGDGVGGRVYQVRPKDVLWGSISGDFEGHDNTLMLF
jgi:hypothetical protein